MRKGLRKSSAVRKVLVLALCGAAFLTAFCDPMPPAVAEALERVKAAGITGGELTETSYDDLFGMRVSFVLKPSIESYIRCELALPDLARWDGRLWAHGNGGWGGCVLCLRGTYPDDSAHVQCDCGTSLYQGRKGPMPKEILKDYSWRAVHLMTVEAKRLIGLYYGRQPVRSYFTGSSTGGGQAMCEAQKFPEDYDGIIAGVPAHSRVSRAALYWQRERLKRKFGKWFTAEERAAIYRAELEYFKKVDPEWARGNFIVDPRPTPEKLAGCWREIVAANPSLADREELWQALFEPVVVRGRRLCSGATFGIEFDTSWTFLFDKFLSDKGPDEITEDELLAFVDLKDIHFEKADLSAFRARGGKMISYAGYEDMAVPAQPISEYYDSVIAAAGGVGEAQSFFVHYVAPGRTHGALGAAFGAGQIGSIVDDERKLIDWVEKGVHPGAIRFRWPARKVALRITPYPENAVTKVDADWADLMNGGLTRVSEGSSVRMDDFTLGSERMSITAAARGVLDLRARRLPFADDDRELCLRLLVGGKPVKVDKWSWHPTLLVREGEVDGWRITTRTMAVVAQACSVIEVTVRNVSAASDKVELRLVTTGTSERAVAGWTGDDPEVVMAAGLKSGASRTYRAALALGDPADVKHMFGKAKEDFGGLWFRNDEAWIRRVKKGFDGFER